MPNTIERLNEELRRIRGELQQVKKPKKKEVVITRNKIRR